MMAPTYEEVMALTDEELQKRYNVATKRTVVGTGYYWDEIVRRRAEKQTDRCHGKNELLLGSNVSNHCSNKISYEHYDVGGDCLCRRVFCGGVYCHPE